MLRSTSRASNTSVLPRTRRGRLFHRDQFGEFSRGVNPLPVLRFLSCVPAIRSYIIGVIMRSFCSGRRSGCLKVLLALFLNVPACLNGQSGSSPPSQPAASAPADSVPSLSPAEGLIQKAREAAFEFSGKLPNFMCEELMSRFSRRGRQEEMPLDMVSAEIIYEDAHENYRNVKINGRPTDKGLEEIGGASSTGEFASTLLDLFNPHTDTQFRSGGVSPISGFSAQVYDFQVRSENSHWMVHRSEERRV